MGDTIQNWILSLRFRQKKLAQFDSDHMVFVLAIYVHT